MPLPRCLSRPLLIRSAVAAVLLAGIALSLRAGEVRLKNGMRIEGKPVPIQGLTQALIAQSAGPTTIYPILLVETPVQRYFVPARQTEEIDKGAELSRLETFTFEQKKSGRRLMLASLGSAQTTPFDEFGRRRVTVTTDRGPLHIIQGITEIAPEHVRVAGLTHTWEHGLATTSVPPETLDAMLMKAIDPSNPDDRMAIARFYLQAEMYGQGAATLEAIVRDFPELKATAEELNVQLMQLRARQLLSELRRRKQAGQHQLAYHATQVFPVEGMSAAVLREVRELAGDYESARAKGERAVMLLGELQAQLNDPAKVAAAAPLRLQIIENLDYATLPRLNAFLTLEGDDSLSPEEKLGLAFTGWLLGSTNAEPDFDLATRLWQARFLALEYLRTDNPATRQQLLADLQAIEGIGPDRVLKMVSQLPPPLHSPQIVPGQITKVEVSPAKVEEGKTSEPAVAYSVLLPQGYNPHHAYPLIVALRPAGRPATDELVWWGFTADEKPGQSQRHGYIVIAPEYLDENAREYDYGVAAHHVVLSSIVDARKRFNVDSDRVFLSGHGMGGDAAFDIGMSHPDLFAGVIPITGVSDKICKWYWSNAESVAWYVVNGELDRNTLEINSRELNRMLRHGYDLIYAEYAGRGYESYYEEIHRLFDWMALHRRAKLPAEIDMKILRPSDNRFYWLEAAGFPANVLQSAFLVDEGRRQRVLPMTFEAKVTAGNSVFITSGAAQHTLWLSPDVIDFEQRVAVRVNGRQKFNGFLQPSIETLLEDLRVRGDRQRLFTVRMVVE